MNDGIDLVRVNVNDHRLAENKVLDSFATSSSSWG